MPDPATPGPAATPAVTAAMRTAMRLAESVQGRTSPNPPVGCVVLDAAGTTVGTGATAPPGGAHAEVQALEQAGARAEGGTAVVTLEPCSHHGRTPPCTDALLRAGVAEVYYAVADPTATAGGGAGLLRHAGVAAIHGPVSGEVELGALRAWLHHSRTGLPHVTWKFAATLDGRVAAADGSSRWISGTRARAETHSMRARCDAVAVGTGTALADDPALTARLPSGELAERQPLRVVIGDTPLPQGAALHDAAAPTLALAGGDPGAALLAMAERGVVDVLLEGGPRLAGAFLAAGAVQRVVAYLAPSLLGQGPVALGAAGVGTISDRIALQLDEVGMLGPDIRLDARIADTGTAT